MQTGEIEMVSHRQDEMVSTEKHMLSESASAHTFQIQVPEEAKSQTNLLSMEVVTDVHEPPKVLEITDIHTF